MTTNLVLTVIGDDKPGLVEALSQAIANNSGNWLESSMSHLAGKFAGILRVSVADAEAGNLRPTEYVFQARADAAAEVQYAPRAGFCDMGP